jgi:hypothetical protein
LAKHAPQPQEDEYRERQENNGVDVEHVSHTFGYRSITSAGFSVFNPSALRPKRPAPLLP